MGCEGYGSKPDVVQRCQRLVQQLGDGTHPSCGLGSGSGRFAQVRLDVRCLGRPGTFSCATSAVLCSHRGCPRRRPAVASRSSGGRRDR